MVSKLQAHLMVDEGDIAPYVCCPDPDECLMAEAGSFREVAYNRSLDHNRSYEGIPIMLPHQEL